MKRHLVNLKLCVLAIGLLGMNPAGLADDLSDPAKVLGNLQVIDQKEIAVGQLAQDNGTTKDVKNYGKKLVDDHKRLADKITQYAKDNHIELTSPPSPDTSAFQGLTGKDFDKKFLDEMVQGHAEAIDMVKKSEAETKDKKLKGFLASVLPSLRSHHATAEHLEKKL